MHCADDAWRFCCLSALLCNAQGCNIVPAAVHTLLATRLQTHDLVPAAVHTVLAKRSLWHSQTQVLLFSA